MPGNEIVLDNRRLARLLEEQGAVLPRAVRRRRVMRELVRYKPERRAVWRVAVPTREGPDRTVGLRVAPPAVVQKTSGARRDLGSVTFCPEMLAVDEQRGVLVEEWLDAEPCPPDSFEHAYDAGALLARLHAAPMAGAPSERRPQSVRELAPLFALDSSLAARASEIDDPPNDGATTWCHGDFHPDQVAKRREDGRVLLDLDLLGVGDPALSPVTHDVKELVLNGQVVEDRSRTVYASIVDDDQLAGIWRLLERGFELSDEFGEVLGLVLGGNEDTDPDVPVRGEGHTRLRMRAGSMPS